VVNVWSPTKSFLFPRGVLRYNKTGTLPYTLPYNLTKTGFVAWATSQWGDVAASTLLSLFPVPSKTFPTYWKVSSCVVPSHSATDARSPCGKSIPSISPILIDQAAERVVGLYMMTCPNRQYAQYHTATRPANSTFVYYFDELPGNVPTKEGVFHGADIRFVFFNVV
jgi:hypothetical protein